MKSFLVRSLFWGLLLLCCQPFAVSQEAGQSGLVDPAIDADLPDWAQMRDLLDALESSADLDQAEAEYLDTLQELARDFSPLASPLPFEDALREYYTKGLSLDPAPAVASALQLGKAESLLRSSDRSGEARRRAEALLAQAAQQLGAQDSPTRPLDTVLARLGLLYMGMEGPGDGPGPGDGSSLARAVWCFENILEMEDAQPQWRELASDNLETLLQPGLSLKINQRFLPGADIRLELLSRNVDALELEVHAVSTATPERSLSLAELADTGRMIAASGSEPLLRRTLQLDRRGRFEWRSVDLRLGDDMEAGFYWVEVRGSGISDGGLLLVTSVQFAALPRGDSGLLLWGADVESGLPLAGVPVNVLDGVGRLLASALTDLDGQVLLEGEAAANWAEAHLSANGSPGLVRREDLKLPRQPLPTVVPQSLRVAPGDNLQWLVLGEQAVLDQLMETGIQVRVADGLELPAGLSRLMDTALIGQVALPLDLPNGGPVFLTMADGRQVLLNHIALRQRFPFNVNFEGERFRENTNIFLSTAPVEVRLSLASVNQVTRPDYVRVRVQEIERRPVLETAQHEASAPPEPILETILSVGSSEVGNVHLELPDLSDSGDTAVLQVDILALNEDQVLGRGFLALVPSRALILLRQKERILKAGESLKLELQPLGNEDGSSRPAAADLVVYRETWQSRYIHRRRGSTISEREFLELPERSLLGSARTDYRLQEQGFVREATQRIPLNPMSDLQFSVRLPEAGYYRMELESPDADLVATYPDGPIEVWVIPESGDLRALRSLHPRLVVDEGTDRDWQALLLLNRKDSTILVEMEYADGDYETRIRQPEGTALYLSGSPSEHEGLRRVRAVVCGERQTDLLGYFRESRSTIGMDLTADLEGGLNPGAEFSWQLRAGDGEPMPVFWTFYRKPVAGMIGQLLRWQSGEQDLQQLAAGPELASLEQWRPLNQPLGAAQAGVGAFPQAGALVQDPVSLGALYPELLPGLPEPGPGLPFSIKEAASEAVAGNLPNSAGRWDFAAFSGRPGGQVAARFWPFSTELPIRAEIQGPPTLRPNDHPTVGLTLNNTLLTRESVEIRFEAAGSIELDGVASRHIDMQPGQRVGLPVAVSAISPGTGRLLASAGGLLTRAEALWETEVLPAASVPALRLRLIDPGTSAAELTFDLQGWRHAQLSISGGIGHFLEAIWPQLRFHQATLDPLLAAFGDWALHQVRLHHGLESDVDSATSQQRLIEQLRLHGGGRTSWMPGGQPDPWLAALLRWGIAIFGDSTDTSLQFFIREADLFLEEVLVSNSFTDREVLLAMGALAAPAFKDPGARPSRIQARSFLSQLHARQQLGAVDQALLLLVARAYGFTEEVRFLAETLAALYDETADRRDRTAFAGALAYLALGDTNGHAAARQAAFRSWVEAVDSSGPRRSRELVAAWIFLLTSFQWEGDFQVEGELEWQLSDDQAGSISLAPDGPDRGLLQIPSNELETSDGLLSLKLNAGSAATPALVMVVGRASQPLWPVRAGAGESLVREFLEPTLLAGPRLRSVPYNLGDPIHSGDLLQMTLSFEVDEPEPMIEIHLPIPSLGELPIDFVQHRFQPVNSDAALSTVPTAGLVALVQQAGPLSRIFRLRSVQPGRHELVLTFSIQWAGEAAFPAALMVYPQTGQTWRMGDNRRIEVAPLSGKGED